MQGIHLQLSIWIIQFIVSGLSLFDHINHMKYLDVKYEWVLDDYDLNIIRVL